MWPDGFIELDLLISSFSSDGDDVYDSHEDDDNDGRKKRMKNDNKTPYIKVDLNTFKDCLDKNFLKIKKVICIKVIPTDQLVIRDADDAENYFDMYEEEKEELRKISTRSKLLKEIPLITKPKICKGFSAYHGRFFKQAVILKSIFIL